MIIVLMINLRSTLIVIFFLLMTFVVIFIAQDVKNKSESYSDLLDVDMVDEAKFKNMNYYSLADGKKSMSMNSDDLKIINQSDFIFQKTDGEFINNKGEVTLFSADSGKYQANIKELALYDNIELKNDEAEYQSNNMLVNKTQNTMSAVGDVNAKLIDKLTKDKITISSRSMNSDLDKKVIHFKGDIQGVLTRNRRYEGGFSFTSELMTLNQLESQINLSKDVKLRRNNYDVEAQKAEIFLENYNKRLKYYVLYDDIKFVEKLKLKSGASRVRRAFAEKLEGFMSQGKIILSGAPRVEQDGDLIKGYQITLRENVELVEVDDSQSSFQLKRK